MPDISAGLLAVLLLVYFLVSRVYVGNRKDRE
jgi:hypothetical protein